MSGTTLSYSCKYGQILTVIMLNRKVHHCENCNNHIKMKQRYILFKEAIGKGFEKSSKSSVVIFLAGKIRGAFFSSKKWHFFFTKIQRLVD